MYAIGDNLYLCRGNNIFTVPLSEQEEVENLDLQQLEYKYQGIEFIKNVEYKQDHPTQHIAIAIRDERGCKKDRKVKIKNYIAKAGYFDNGYYHYIIEINTETRGYKKIGCVWVPYKTQLAFKNVYGEINYNNNQRKTFRIQSKNSYIPVWKIEGYFVITDSYTRHRNTFRNILSNVYFTKDHGEATSRGVGNLWAVIKYNY